VDEKYKSKSFIDTAVYALGTCRGVAAAWIGVRRGRWGCRLAGCWLVVAAALGTLQRRMRNQRRRERLSECDGSPPWLSSRWRARQTRR